MPQILEKQPRHLQSTRPSQTPRHFELYIIEKRMEPFIRGHMESLLEITTVLKAAHYSIISLQKGIENAEFRSQLVAFLAEDFGNPTAKYAKTKKVLMNFLNKEHLTEHFLVFTKADTFVILDTLNLEWCLSTPAEKIENQLILARGISDEDYQCQNEAYKKFATFLVQHNA